MFTLLYSRATAQDSISRVWPCFPWLQGTRPRSIPGEPMEYQARKFSKEANVYLPSEIGQTRAERLALQKQTVVIDCGDNCLASVALR